MFEEWKKKVIIQPPISSDLPTIVWRIKPLPMCKCIEWTLEIVKLNVFDLDSFERLNMSVIRNISYTRATFDKPFLLFDSNSIQHRSKFDSLKLPLSEIVNFFRFDNDPVFSNQKEGEVSKYLKFDSHGGYAHAVFLHQHAVTRFGFPSYYVFQFPRLVFIPHFRYYARNHHVEIQRIECIIWAGFKHGENDTKHRSNCVWNESRANSYCFSSLFLIFTISICVFTSERTYFFVGGFCVRVSVFFIYLFTLIVAISDVFIRRDWAVGICVW